MGRDRRGAAGYASLLKVFWPYLDWKPFSTTRVVAGARRSAGEIFNLS